MAEYIDKLKQRERDAQQNDILKYLAPISAGLGAVALGSYIYKSTFAGQGGNVVANLLHFLGRPGQIGVNVEKLANSGAAEAGATTGLRSWLSSTFNLNLNKVQLGPIDIISDLTGAIDIIGSTRVGQVKDKIASRVTEYINRKYTNSGVGASFFSQNLERITTDQVLGNKGEWTKIIGENQWNALDKAKKLGIIGQDTILDKGIFKTNKGFLRDTRIRSIFLKEGEEGKLTSKIDLFGQWKVIKSWVGDNTGIARLQNFGGTKGRSYFIDGNVYAYSREGGTYTEHVLAKNQKLREVGDSLSIIRNAKEGNLQKVIKTRTGFFGKIISSFEEATGVGTSFQNRYSFYQRLITNPIKRLYAISTGKAVIRRSYTEKSKGFTVFLDDLYGAHYPEIVTSRPRSETMASEIVDFKSLSNYQKLFLLFDRTSQHTLLNHSGSTRLGNLLDAKAIAKIEDKDLFTPRPPGGGYKVKSKTGKDFYAAPKSRIIPGLTSGSDFANYLVYRVSHLASESLGGISFFPGSNLLTNTARLAAIPLIYEAGRQAFNYADYLSEKYIGISPTKLAATAYAKARVAQQKLREYTGIQQGLKAADDAFPGIVNSDLSTLGRSIVGPAVAFGLLSKGSIEAGVLGAAAVYAAVGGPEPTETSEDLQKEYSGDKKVAIRKGRYWGIGTQAFSGGEIERYDYSWYHKLMKDPETRSLYGSQDEYWKYHANVFGIPMPTPSNLFGVRNILNPYRLEQINKSSRPYEATGHPIEEFPIFGPILGATVGKILKPTIYRSGVLPEGLSSQTARDLGMPDITHQPGFSDSVVDRMKKIGNVALEPLGLYKFVMEYFGVSLEPNTEQMATSDIMQSAARRFYGKSLGGMLGETEFIRRFLLSDYGNATNIARMTNRVQNDMPDWMPGTGSSFEKDRSYFMDFHLGDPYSKMSGGSWRLPGVGYESVSQLESGKPGEYSPVDRFLILADVAPWSDAYRKYERIVSKMPLTPEWREKVEAAKQQKIAATSIENRYPRYADSLISLNEHIHDSASYKQARGLYDMFTHDFLAEIPVLGSKLAPFRDPYEKYRKMYIEGSEFASWYTTWEDIQRPALYDIALSNPIMGAVKGGVIGSLLSSPFMSWASPVAMGPARSLVGGAILGGALSTARIAAGVPDNYVPQHVREQSKIFDYLDSLTYIKNRSLEELAISNGLDSSEFRKARKKTMIGANTSIMVRASLPTSTDKKYFDVFLNTPSSNRDELLAGVSPHMAEALTKVWYNDYNSQESGDAEAYSNIQDIGLPGYSSLAWHPSVDNKSMQLKLIMHGLNGVSDNYHRYGFFESHEATIRTRFPDLWDESISFTPPPNYDSGKDFMNTVGQNIYSSQSSMFSSPFGARYTKRLQIDRSNDVMNVIKGRY